MASAVSRARLGSGAFPASTSVYATATRLATPAATRTASLAVRDASSARAIFAAAVASFVGTVDQTQQRKTTAATVQPSSVAADQPVAMIVAAVVTMPQPAATATRRAASPARSSRAPVGAEE